MKKLIIAGLMMGAVLAAHADTIQIDWSTWAFDHNATSVAITDPDDDTGGILYNYDVLWQLIRTDSGTPALPDLTADHYLGAGDSWLDERLLTKDNSGVWNKALFTFDNVTTDVSIDDKTTIDHYYVYQRIYELESGTTAPVAGTWYYDSEAVDLAGTAPWGSGSPIAIYAFGDPDQETGVKPNKQVPGVEPAVPEPATMSLLGLGALAMVLRRKLRK